MKRKSSQRKSPKAPVAPPKEPMLATIGYRFHEIRTAKRYAQTSLARGWEPRVILARALQLCRSTYAKLPESEQTLMTDVVMSAISCVIADWKSSPDPSLSRINDWIDRTVASNRNFITVGVTGGRR
ncbi:hypothetical protein [Singulisphaera sp. PoT]|uniref:hypothetical protein n=1 Tax=Singulisphaera sp. PoT TaxID=3411797 RepID=UPI003BF55D8F